jgi:mono/diheme cytochrome c family protein
MRRLVALVVILTMLGLACTQSSPTPTPAPEATSAPTEVVAEPTDTPEVTATEVVETTPTEKLEATATEAADDTPAAAPAAYTDGGCNVCHGANGEGGIGPALAGTDHSFDEVTEVVRNGEGGMPAFSEDKLSDDDLKAIYDWAVSLPAAEESDHVD